MKKKLSYFRLTKELEKNLRFAHRFPHKNHSNLIFSTFFEILFSNSESIHQYEID